MNAHPLDPDPHAAAVAGGPARHSSSWATSRTRTVAARCMAAGIAAWLITVSPLLVGRGLPLAGRVAAGAALLACVAGTQAIHRHHRLARGLGITAYMGLAVAAWVLAAGHRVMTGFDPWRGFCGVLAWATYAASWSHPWSLPDVRLEEAPEGASMGLKPRRGAQRRATLIGVWGAGAGLVCLALAWSVDDASRAVWARAVGVLAAVALTSAAASVAAGLVREERVESAQRLPVDGRIVRAILVILVLVAAGFALARLR